MSRKEKNVITGEITIHEDAPIVIPEPLTIAQIETNKDRQVNEELGSDTIRVIIGTIVPMIQDGSIASKTPEDIIDQVKANRKAEL